MSSAETGEEARRGRKPGHIGPASILWLFLLSRLYSGLFVYIGHLSHPYLENIEGAYRGVSNWWLNPWTTFDSQHFLDIAISGYTQQNSVFFPLYPALLRLAGQNEVTVALWGCLLSQASFLASLFLLARFLEANFSTAQVKLALGLICFYPATAMFGMVYTESVFLLLFLVGMLALQRRRWAVAALALACAALTRNSGAALFLALLADFCSRRPVAGAALKAAGPLETLPNAEKVEKWPRFLVALAPLMALVLVQGLLGQQFGSLAGVANQSVYFREPNFPWVPLLREAWGIASGRGAEFGTLMNFSATVLGLWLTVLLARRGEYFHAVFMGTLLLMTLTLGRALPPHTAGSLRYMMTTVPFFVGLILVLPPTLVRPIPRVTLWTALLFACAMQSYLLGYKSFFG